jgi:hypothetical protein
LAGAEWRLRSVPRRFSDAALAQLKAQGAMPWPRVPFELIPLRNTAADLRDLGLLALRVLLVNASAPRAIVVDEALSLARQVADEHDASKRLPERVADVFGRDARWLESLGPHQMTGGEISPAEAATMLPMRLWFAALASIIRMFPGVGPDSLCPDEGYGPAGGSFRVFDPSLADFNLMVVQTRGLIVTDWRFNEEVHRVIRRHQSATGVVAAGLAMPKA